MLLIFAASFAVMIYGVAVLGWWMAEISGVFLAAAIIVGVITRMGEKRSPVPLLTARGIYSAWR